MVRFRISLRPTRKLAAGDPRQSRRFLGPEQLENRLLLSSGPRNLGLDALQMLLGGSSDHDERFAEVAGVHASGAARGPVAGFAHASGALALVGFGQNDRLQLTLGGDGTLRSFDDDRPLPIVDLLTGLPCQLGACPTAANTTAVTVLLGEGDDELALSGDGWSSGIDLAIFSGAGNDFVSISLFQGTPPGSTGTATVDKPEPRAALALHVDTGDGNDVVEATVGAVGEPVAIQQNFSLQIDQGAGDDVLEVNLFVAPTGTTGTLALQSDAGPGDDKMTVAVNIAGSSSGDVQVELDGGAGDDTIQFTATGIVSGIAMLRGGDGSDALVLFAPDAAKGMVLTVDGGAGYDVCTTSGANVSGCEEVQFVVPSGAGENSAVAAVAETATVAHVAGAGATPFTTALGAGESDDLPAGPAAATGAANQGRSDDLIISVENHQRALGGNLLGVAAGQTGGSSAGTGSAAAAPRTASDRVTPETPQSLGESLQRLTGTFGQVVLQLDGAGLLDQVGLLLEDTSAMLVLPQSLNHRRLPDPEPPKDPLSADRLDAAFEDIGAQRIADENLVHDSVVEQLVWNRSGS